MPDTIVHVPPNEKFLKEQMLHLIDYANDKITNEFIHPVIKAPLLHFWLGYLHPFTDGKMRRLRLHEWWAGVARLLFI